MSWSHNLIKSTLEEFKDESFEMNNLSSAVSFHALLDYHEESLEDPDFKPFFITGENLPINIGDTLEVRGLEAKAVSWDYKDDTYQVVNIDFTPLFKIGDMITDHSLEHFEITHVEVNLYRIKQLSDGAPGILPLIYQDVARKI